MTIAGTSVLTLKGANTFSNGVNVNGSTVTAQIGVNPVGSVGAITSSAFGSASALSLTAGEVSSDGTSPRTLLEAVTFKGSMTLGDATNNGALDFKGGCTLNVSPTLTINSPVTIEGIIGQSGTQGMTIAGTSVLTLKGANTFGNGVSLNSGTVQVGVNSVGSVGAITSSAFGGGPATGVSFNGGTISSDGTTARLVYQSFTFGKSGTYSVALGDAANNGALTFAGAITLHNAGTVTVNSPVTFSGPISTNNGAGLTKSGSGTLTLNNGSNSYTGATTIGAGTLLLGANNALPASSALVLSGGTLSTGGYSQATSSPLTLQGNSVIDLGVGSTSVLSVGDSSAATWTPGMTLIVEDWNGALAGNGTERLMFGSSTSALTGTELGDIQFLNPAGLPSATYSAQILSTGEVVPIPEPGTLLLLAVGLLGLLAYAWRKRK